MPCLQETWCNGSGRMNKKEEMRRNGVTVVVVENVEDYLSFYDNEG